MQTNFTEKYAEFYLLLPWNKVSFLNNQTLCLIHESHKARNPKDSAEDEASGHGYVRDNGESLEGAIPQRSIDEVGIMVTDKSCIIK